MRIAGCRLVPIGHGLLPFAIRQQRQRAHGAVGLCDDAAQQLTEVIREAGNRTGVPQVGVVFERGGQAAAIRTVRGFIDHEQGQVNLGCAAVDIERGGIVQARQPSPACALRVSRLNMTWKTGVMLRLRRGRLVHQQVEGQVLVILRLQPALAHLVQQLAERHFTSGVRSELRMTSVLTKNPMRPSSSGRVRLAIGVPTQESLCPV